MKNRKTKFRAFTRFFSTPRFPPRFIWWWRFSFSFHFFHFWCLIEVSSELVWRRELTDTELTKSEIISRDSTVHIIIDHFTALFPSIFQKKLMVPMDSLVARMWPDRSAFSLYCCCCCVKKESCKFGIIKWRPFLLSLRLGKDFPLTSLNE